MAVATKKPSGRRWVWRRGTRCSVPAAAFGRLLEGRHEIPAAELVALARRRSSPIHKAFPWCDRTAAEAHRLELARYYLRSLRVIEVEVEAVEPSAPEIAWVQVVNERRERVYASAERVAQREDYREYAIREALAALNGLRARYNWLVALDGVWRAIDAANKPPKPPRKRRGRRPK